MSDLERLRSAAVMAPIPEFSIIFFGPDPVWTPEKEGVIPIGAGSTAKSKSRKKTATRTPSTADCPLCRGLMTLEIGQTVYIPGDAEATEVTLDAPLAVRRARLDEPGTFFLADGRVVQPVDKGDMLLDAETLVVSCARCHRVPKRYDRKLRGGLHDVAEKDIWRRPGKLAARVVGSTDPNLNAYEKHRRERAVVRDDEAKRARRKAARKTKVQVGGETEASLAETT